MLKNTKIFINWVNKPFNNEVEIQNCNPPKEKKSKYKFYKFLSIENRKNMTHDSSAPISIRPLTSFSRKTSIFKPTMKDFAISKEFGNIDFITIFRFLDQEMEELHVLKE